MITKILEKLVQTRSEYPYEGKIGEYIYDYLKKNTSGHITRQKVSSGRYNGAGFFSFVLCEGQNLAGFFSHFFC